MTKYVILAGECDGEKVQALVRERVYDMCLNKGGFTTMFFSDYTTEIKKIGEVEISGDVEKLGNACVYA